MDMDVLTGLEPFHRLTTSSVDGLKLSQEKTRIVDGVLDKVVAQRCGEGQDSDTAADEVLGD